ncbi:MAG: exodeoxyribonuclease V subunit gamma [Planctomycetota bacterium JB042]
MPWSVLGALADLLGHPAFADVRRYLAADPDLETPRAHRFAGRVATLFDRYHAYRPDLCRRWRDGGGEGDGWQPVLWNAVRERLGGDDPAARAERFLERCAGAPLDAPGLPPRVSVFGVSMLPPLWVRLLAALARHVPVDLFVPAPSREYWGHVRTSREARRARREAAATGIDPDDLALDDGHPLLAAFGRLGRDFQEALEDETYVDAAGEALFEAPGDASTLRAVQTDLLELRPATKRPADGSIAVHACHSPMRQVEVLHDRLLALFAERTDLEPRDVLCMTPDLETFAPLVEAVFGTDRAEQESIPFRIADQRVRRESAVADAFLRIVELAGGRLAATEVFDVLSLPVVSDRFGLDAGTLDRVGEWIRGAGVRWGRDAAHRAAERQPETDRNTWRFGLDRLLLGLAMRGDGGRTFAGVLPVDDVEGTETAALGGLAAFVEALAERTRDLERGPRPLGEWVDAFLRVLELIARDDRNAWEHEAVRDALLALPDEAAAGRFDGRLDLAAARDVLAARVDRAAPGAVFAAGGVTFCEMVPMRSVPHAVVCLLGLDDGVFPRGRPAASFDLVRAAPRAGDRDPRDEDRQLFLEALLAARDRLLILHTGRSVRTNERLPPSVVVSELVEAVGEVETQEHPLQAFAPAAFRADDAARQSYRADLVAGARAIDGEGSDPEPFVSAPLPPRPEEVEEGVVSLDALRRTLENPARTLLRERLRVAFPGAEETFEDREAMDLGPLEAWQLRHGLLEGLASGRAIEEVVAAARAAGSLPLGTRGEMLLDDAAERMRTFLAELRSRGVTAPEWLEVDVPVGGGRVVGRVPIRPGADVALFVKDSSDKPKYRLAAWIFHLAAHVETGRPFETLLVTYDKKRPPHAKEQRLAAVDDAREHLARLVALHERARGGVVPFEPETSWALVTDGWAEARKAWAPSFIPDGAPPPPSKNLYFARVFDTGQLVDCDGFEETARAVREPLLASLAAGGGA